LEVVFYISYFTGRTQEQARQRFSSGVRKLLFMTGKAQ